MEYNTAINIVEHHWNEWNKTNKTQRFGQYLINMGVINGSHPNLFYETVPQRALDIAMEILTKT